jgi:hypothetical protein
MYFSAFSGLKRLGGLLRSAILSLTGRAIAPPPSTDHTRVQSAVDLPGASPNSPPALTGDKQISKSTKKRYIRDKSLAEQRQAKIVEYKKRMLDKFGAAAIRERFGRDRIPHNAIYRQAGEGKPEFYRWLSGQTPDGSRTDENIKTVLRSSTLPRKPSRRG